MTDRDFKLLVREYFELTDHYEYYAGIDPDQYEKQRQALTEKIRKELERFTEQEQQELPFKD